MIADIRAETNRKRRTERGKALLSVLDRGWRDVYADHAEVMAVYTDYGWQAVSRVPATWLSRAASTPWLTSQSGALGSPKDLAIRSAANCGLLGDDRSQFVAGISEELARSPAIAALRITTDPRASQILDSLDVLSAATIGPDVEATAASLYALLSSKCPVGEVSDRVLVDDVTVSALRTRFGAGRPRRGLILSGGRWKPPGAVFQGRALFGSRRSFVPGEQALALWKVLGVSEPDVRDCVQVLREIAADGGPPNAEDRAVLIDTYRHMAGQLTARKIPPATRKTIGSLPLWTGRVWVKERPVYVTIDPRFRETLGAEVTTWQPPCAVSGLEPLLPVLGVVVVRPVAVAGVGPSAAVAGDGIGELFRLAVGHLRDRLAEGDPVLSGGVRWEELLAARVALSPNLAVELEVPGRASVLARVGAHVTNEPIVFFARDASEAGSSEEGGRAIAQCFRDGDRDKLSYIWADAWRHAEKAERPQGLELASSKSGIGEPVDVLAQQLRGVGTRALKKRSSPANPPIPVPSAARRELKDLAELTIGSVTRVNAGSAPGEVRPVRRRGLRATLPSQPSNDRAPASATVGYGPEEADDLAHAIVEQVLAGDEPGVVDYRRRRGIGADAVDTLRRFYEMKRSVTEPPDEITLTANEAERAYTNPDDFFVVVVSGLERGYDTEVRFIWRPLETLDWRPSTGITLAGIRSKDALLVSLSDVPSEPENAQ